MPKEQLEFFQIEVGDDIQPAVRRKQAIRDDGMEMGIQVHQIAEGLNRHNHAGDRLRLLQGGLEEGFHTGIGALAECAQEAAILSDIDAEHLGDSEHILARGNRRQHVRGDPCAKLPGPASDGRPGKNSGLCMKRGAGTQTGIAHTEPGQNLVSGHRRERTS